MKISHIRPANIFLLFIMFANHGAHYCWYIAAMHISLEILNHRKGYLQQSYKLYNFIFWGYSLVLLERLRSVHFNASAEWLLNCAEHLFFGIVICLKVYIYTAVFTNVTKPTRLKRGVAAFLLFNVIGVVNEVFQNWLSSRNLFVFIADSMKDMGMNIIGATVFFTAVIWRMLWLKKSAAKQSATSFFV